MRNFSLSSVLAACFVILLAASAALAQTKDQVAALGGVSGSPGQAFVSGHIDLKELKERIWFRPSVDIGVGDGLFQASLNAEVVYFFLKKTSREWLPYVGLGPSFIVRGFYSGDGDVITGGGNFVIGIQERKGLVVEVKIGAFDSPGFKAAIGWTWPRK